MCDIGFFYPTQFALPQQLNNHVRGLSTIKAGHLCCFNAGRHPVALFFADIYGTYLCSTVLFIFLLVDTLLYWGTHLHSTFADTYVAYLCSTLFDLLLYFLPSGLLYNRCLFFFSLLIVLPVTCCCLWATDFPPRDNKGIYLSSK